MTNAQIRDLAKAMCRRGEATNLTAATHKILADINAEATAYYRVNLPAGDR